MLPYLFRMRHGEELVRRPAKAALHRARSALPERPAPDMDRMVHAAPPALVPCSDGVWNAGCGTGASLDDVPAAAHSNPVFSHHNALADRHHPLRELHVSELSCSCTGVSAAR